MFLLGSFLYPLDARIKNEAALQKIFVRHDTLKPLEVNTDHQTALAEAEQPPNNVLSGQIPNQKVVQNRAVITPKRPTNNYPR